MAVNGKQKGNRFERDISNILSERFALFLGVQTGFRRNIDSGSFFGGSNVSRVESHSLDFAVFGDIVCPKNFNYTIECKNYKDPPTMNNLLLCEIKQWDEWIKQAKEDSTKGNKKMLLIVKYNRTETFCIIEDNGEFTHPIKYKEYIVLTLEEFLKKEDLFYFQNLVQL